ncbi:sensor histidine kinase [Rhizohabitans arisaemae]|uniref:sensor histidine kinase n=1 Tax=Rhizohabitans arisaemae TaxID=2720610 RepID=UPI0024B10A02|nr:histidine kinase [Rhizohabitans arisaemae]
MLDTRRSLTSQSILVAIVAAVADVGFFLFVPDRPPLEAWRFLLVLGLIVGSDLALAGPPRTSGVVAVLHAFSWVLVPVVCDGPWWESAKTGLLVAGYRAGAWLPPIPALTALGALAAGVLGAQLAVGTRVQALPMVAIEIISLALLPWLVGRYTTARRAYISELERREERRLLDEQTAVQRAVTEDRSAIARDLHDTISHHVSAIGVHAGAARLGLDSAGDDVVHRSMLAIESGSRAAMADLRRMLDLLHGEETVRGNRQPGLGNLEELVEGVRSLGLAVTVTVHGPPTPLPGSLDVAVYRIAQEGLTNALRHGGGDDIDVEVEYRRDEVILTIVNELAPARRREPQGTRRGLNGIRQRAALFGGRLTYGVRPDEKSWRLRVSFPVDSSCLPESWR